MASASVQSGAAGPSSSSSQANNSSSGSTLGRPFAVDRRVERLEYLLEQSYSKIDELRHLLIEESELRQIDCTIELDDIFARQNALHDNAVKCINESSVVSRRPDIQNSGQTQKMKLTAVMSSSRRPRDLEFRNQFQTSGSVPRSRSAREIPKFDTEERKWNDMPSNDNLVQVKDENRWYGSLDRNVVKKKKRTPIDKSRRHTKVVGSMATLERTEELQPDEKYRVGLPMLPSLNLPGKVALDLSRKRSPQPMLLEQKPSPTPPMRPPKSNAFARSKIHETPSQSFQTLQTGFFDTESVAHHLYRERGEKSEDVKTWFETNLDDSGFANASYPNEIIIPNASSSGYSSGSGALDVTDSLSRLRVVSPVTDVSEKSSKSSESSESRAFVNEVIKPFEMADYYKYSTKFRQTQPCQSYISRADAKNGNIHTINLMPDNDGVDTNFNSSHAAPRLPPKDSTSHYMLSVGANSDYLQDNSEDDSDSGPDLGWVMDGPKSTFV